MKAYTALFLQRFKMLLQYRTAAWAGIATQFFFGFLRVMVFVAFFQSTGQIQPLGFSSTVSYIWLSQALLLIVPFRIDKEIHEMIRSGSVAYELLRPVSLYPFWLSRQIANRIVPVLLRSFPQILIAAWLFPLLGFQNWMLAAPASWSALLMFFVTLSGSFILGACFSMLMALSLFWTISGEGLSTLFQPLLWLLSGIIVPIPFFPDWLQPSLQVLPFRGLLDIPLQSYLGILRGPAFFQALIFQWLWIGILVCAGFWILSRGLKRIAVQGG